jgi:hypothetical protein
VDTPVPRDACNGLHSTRRSLCEQAHVGSRRLISAECVAQPTFMMTCWMPRSLAFTLLVGLSMTVVPGVQAHKRPKKTGTTSENYSSSFTECSSYKGEIDVFGEAGVEYSGCSCPSINIASGSAACASMLGNTHHFNLLCSLHSIVHPLCMLLCLYSDKRHPNQLRRWLQWRLEGAGGQFHRSCSGLGTGMHDLCGVHGVHVGDACSINACRINACSSTHAASMYTASMQALQAPTTRAPSTGCCTCQGMLRLLCQGMLHTLGPAQGNAYCTT